VSDAVDSITTLFEQTKHQAASWRHRLMARADLERTRRFEESIPSRFDQVIVSSRHDASAFRHRGTASTDSVVTLPNGVDLEYFQPGDRACAPATVLFTGKMSYHANDAAALRLVERIMPRVWRRRADVQVIIAGKDPSPAIRLLTRDSRVTVTGFVEDLRSFFWSATVVVAPLVYGTGIQNKVLEAMACGVPVVASPKACEGISAVGGRDVLVGADDDEIGEHVLTLIGDAHIRARIARDARLYVAAHHDWNELGRRLIDVYQEARVARRRCA
jgi:glycosyltransferase involved in cell wall biosynthesis